MNEVDQDSFKDRFKLSENDERRLKEWKGRHLFLCPTSHPDHRMIGAVLGYMARRLSRGQIPDVNLVSDTLEGKLKIPDCGYIGCNLHESMGDHVH